ncbi:hypothetical protein M0208_12180 [Sphingomonas sp. SUN019]|uniref:hypothetical protein n=1 Tax=Sphingomonas sp. SUN019 TaxID=2937788 RepID=UPI0021649AF8|nr:hypothetical protein [Sphingomonas sp. SUN019]UVO51226.1 hypothetical protein M0208_12180 [Sphingomonas sp. SUN019]
MSISLSLSPSAVVHRTALATDSFGAAIDAALRTLRDRGRRAIRIVDLDSRSGKRLIRVAERARALGFLSIEARGCARSRLAAQAARRAAALHKDHAIGWHFDVTAAEPALAEEEDGADIVLVSARTLTNANGHGDRLARALFDVADDTLVVTTPPEAAAHTVNVLADALRHPGARGAAHPDRRAILVGTDADAR